MKTYKTSAKYPNTEGRKCGMENKYALAMYDIRGKQEFIYRSSRIKEIIGGSALIRDCFKELYKSAEKKSGEGIFHNK